MARINVRYVCGCGFRTVSLVEAILHSDQKHHSLDVQGVIQKDPQPKPKES